MKKYLLGLLFAGLAAMPALAAFTVIQGELIGSPGTYPVFPIDSAGRLQVLSGLPTGAATDTNQTVGNAYLSSLDTKTPTLVNGNVPVNVMGGAVQISGTAVVSGIVQIAGTVPVSGTVTVAVPTYQYKNITGNGTTTVKSGAGTLRAITINTPGTLSSITVYDSTTGSGAKIGTINTVLGQSSLDYQVEFTNGLTIVAAGTLAADITISYK